MTDKPDLMKMLFGDAAPKQSEDDKTAEITRHFAELDQPHFVGVFLTMLDEIGKSATQQAVTLMITDRADRDRSDAFLILAYRCSALLQLLQHATAQLDFDPSVKALRETRTVYRDYLRAKGTYMAAKTKVHQSVTLERVMDAVQRHMQSLDNPGFCLACGNEAEGVEPDARKYVCEACGEKQVYGADEVLLMGAYHAER